MAAEGERALMPRYDEAQEGMALDSSNIAPPTVDLRGLELVLTPDENLICPICHTLLVSPISLPCEHVFCGECIEHALKHQPARSKACPSCRTPTAESLITPTPKLITRILDDIQVKCPLAPFGCSATLARASVQDHVNFYCGFVLVNCPHDGCAVRVERRFADRPCLHQSMDCGKCGKTTTEADLDRHRRSSCNEKYQECNGCQCLVASTEFDPHANHCMAIMVSCTASRYGCDFTDERKAIGQHEHSCPLKKLGPFLEQQKSRLDDHQRALRHLKLKTEIYEEGLTNVQETLRDSLEGSAALAQSSGINATSPPFESQAAHLLDLHDALQNDVRRISTAVSDLDAKLEVSVLNQTLRANEEKLHRDAMEGQMRKQLQWLVSSRLQSHQRGVGVMKPASRPPDVAPSSGPAAPGAGTTVDPSGSDSEVWGASSSPIRRLSDSSRQETKL